MPTAQKQRWLIVGLGNQGRKYTRTRHNLGARVVEALRHDVKLPALKAHTELFARTASHTSLILAVPTTFMNDSGRAIRALLQYAHLPAERLVVVHDDKDLTFGTVKLQKNRSAAGHRGVASVIDALGTKDFWRLRVGIGAPPLAIPTEEYVLQRFTTAEEKIWNATGLKKSLTILCTHVDTTAHRVHDAI